MSDIETILEGVTTKYVDELIDFAPTDDIKEAGIAPLQRDASVALFNMLERNGLAYLADEVGMGKTYIALAVMCLVRYRNPKARVLILTPRQNIQDKWAKDLRNFVRDNWKTSDHRVRSVQGGPVWPVVRPQRLSEWLNQHKDNPDSDSVLRTTSFSLAIGEDAKERKDSLDRINKVLSGFNLDLDCSDAEAFINSYTDAIAETIKPDQYDLVIVDEAHNLKHGYSVHGSSNRNTMLYKLFGSESRRPKKLLLLSATPMEAGEPNTLVNQFQLFGQGAAEIFSADSDDFFLLSELRKLNTSKLEDRRLIHERLRSLLVRRVGTVEVNKQTVTRNMYRREWRLGGYESVDKPMRQPEPPSRLMSALIQKRLVEELGNKYNGKFQTGMLESFEVYAGQGGQQMTESESNTDERINRGADADMIKQLSMEYANQFSRTIPHPKMDETANHIYSLIGQGEKALVFVRRVASTRDLARRINHKIDDRLYELIRKSLSADNQLTWDSIYQAFGEIRGDDDLFSDKPDDLESENDEGVDDRVGTSTPAPQPQTDEEQEEDDPPDGIPNFFGWWFQGKVSGLDKYKDHFNGRWLMEQLQSKNRFSILLQENYVDWIADRPESLERWLLEVSGLSSRDELAAEIGCYVDPEIQRNNYVRFFHAIQAAALSWLKQLPQNCLDAFGVLPEQIEIVLDEAYGHTGLPHREEAKPADIDVLLVMTLFSHLEREPELGDLYAGRYPSVEMNLAKFRTELRKREQIRLLQVAHLRHGMGRVEIYLAALECDEGDLSSRDGKGLHIEKVAERICLNWVFDESFKVRQELSEIKSNFDLICKVNFPSIDQIGDEKRPLDVLISDGPSLRSTARGYLNHELKMQRPASDVTGASRGERLDRLVRQFRMPGMPYALVATNVLEEGEDLHTFCSNVIHYGISHTASSIEQRTGRVDRIGGQFQRKVAEQKSLNDDNKIQCWFPYQAQTIEVHQVARVLSRCNRFLRALHNEESIIESKENDIYQRFEIEPQIVNRLESPFQVENSPWLNGADSAPSRESDFDETVCMRDLDCITEQIEKSGLGFTFSKGQGLVRHGDDGFHRLEFAPYSEISGDELMLEVSIIKQGTEKKSLFDGRMNRLIGDEISLVELIAQIGNTISDE